ncbi:MAG: class C beta-lactamase-related serine hydrolase [Bacteroidetes bacterium]|nr:MAG: class C beta-lactamase-related serine hydrolase [Bacteroidota bacterium]
MSNNSNRNRSLTRRIIRSFLFLILAVFILLNLFIILSGRFYLYKGIANTYLKGQSGPGIYELDVFYHTTIQTGKPDSWKIRSKNQQNKLSTEELNFLKSLKTKAFLVFRGDSLIAENYWDEHDANTVSNSFSAAKTVVALLVGIAIDEGKIKSLDEPAVNYLPDFDTHGKEKITIRDLLLMASGLDWKESSKDPLSENAESYYGSDLYGLVHRQKRISESGKLFNYQSGNSQVLGFIVEKATGMGLSDYLQEKLWKPMGAEHEAYWSLDKENGDEKAFCCLYSTARDFGKLGKLILNKGQINGRQIIPEWYMEELVSLAPMDTDEGIKNQRYGLHIWIYKDPLENIAYCRGIKGQYIMSLPKENLVIVRLGMDRMDNFVIPEGTKVSPEKRSELNNKVGHPEDLFTYLKIGRRLAN